MSRTCYKNALPFFALALTLVSCPLSVAQDTSKDQSWSSSSQQGTPGGAINPTRTNVTHTESGGRTVDKASTETVGPDGRYIPFSDTEKESVRVNATTVRNVERTYGRDADGRRTLIQERQEEAKTLPGGGETVSRTLSSPDGNGGLQIIRRESEESKQISPGVRVTNTTVMTPDSNGGFAAAVRTEQRESKNGSGTVEAKKSVLLSDGVGGWNLSEVRESTTRKDGEVQSKEERVLRPDASGKLEVVERTVSRDGGSGPDDKRGTTETYSTNVPGVAGSEGLQLVRRETTVQRKGSNGVQNTTRQVEQPTPGNVSDGLHVTQEAIDIVRPSSGGTSETQTIMTKDANGQMGEVWVDMGSSNKSPAAPVETKPTPKSAAKPAPKPAAKTK